MNLGHDTHRLALRREAGTAVPGDLRLRLELRLLGHLLLHRGIFGPRLLRHERYGEGATRRRARFER